MLDPNFIRKNPDQVRKGLADKGETGESLEWFIQRDKELRRLITEEEQLAAQQGRMGEAIAAKKKSGEDAAAEIASVAEIKAKRKELSEKVEPLKDDLRKLLMRMPNLAAPDVPVGDASANRVDVTWGDEPKFDFK